MPAKNTSVALGEPLQAFVEQQVAQGRYASASEVVRAGLRLLEDQEARLAHLRSALAEGEASGPTEPFDFDEFITERRGKPGG
ncbi:MAG: type II toxin-antitoxin system ParD family antitoxin [Proteobacteria bacterium]|nr:type II toxin-antitoxin system ParD family antitoxin [Pseudomonadota bacterium]